MQRTARAIEFGALFFVGPALLAVAPWRRLVIPIILAAGILVLVGLLRDRTFDRRQLVRTDGIWREVRVAAARWAVVCLLVGSAFAVLQPDMLFGLARRRPGLLALIVAFYPFFSAYPQEVIFRAFLFHRYAVVFRSTIGLIAASAVAFGWAHIILHNALSIAFTVVGGALFALTYSRTRSVVAAWIEHALYGVFIFVIGLGPWFYGGQMAPIAPETPIPPLMLPPAVEASKP